MQNPKKCNISDSRISKVKTVLMYFFEKTDHWLSYYRSGLGILKILVLGVMDQTGQNWIPITIIYFFIFYNFCLEIFFDAVFLNN